MRRNHEVKLKYEKDEKEKLERKAEQFGLKVSQYIRLVSLKANMVVSK